MSSKQSFLSSPKFGYDIAVGVTQASVNATMKQYLDGLPMPEVVLCFVDDKGVPKLIDYEQLKKNANGADPFNIPNNADPESNQDIIKLKKARFVAGIKAKIGLPQGLPPDKIPDVVTLEQGTSYVKFRLMCAEFMAVELAMRGYDPATWVNVLQNPKSPLQFTAMIDLKKIPADNDKLPPTVKKQKEEFIKAGYGFTIQQLYLDLDTAFGSTAETDIEGVEKGTMLKVILERYFMDLLLKTLKSNPAPALGYSFSEVKAPQSTLAITNTTMVVSPYVDAAGDRIPTPTPIQREVSTLNYQCTINDKKPPQTVSFNWNWVEVNEMSDFDGVMAINRNAFANYLHDQLINHAARNCYKSTVRVWRSGFLDLQVNFSWGLAAYQQPKVTFSETGPVVLSFSYHSEAYDGAGANDWMGRMSLSPTYDATVTFSNNTIIIKQRLVIYLRIGALANDASGNVIDRTITDTYHLTIENNKLVAKQTTTTEDHPTMGAVGDFFNFFTGVDDMVKNVNSWLQDFTQTQLTSMPLSVVQDFIFPGGNAFAFKKVMFSDKQDLISHITYLAPETASFLKVPNNR